MVHWTAIAMKKGKILFNTAAALIVITLFLGVYVHKINIKKRTVYSHRDEYHRIIQSLFDKEIVDNQSAENLIQRYPPTKVSNHDNYLTLQYVKNNEEVEDCCVVYSYYIQIIARNDRLVKAFATEGFYAETDYVFFDVLDDTAENAYWDSRMKNAITVSRN